MSDSIPNISINILNSQNTITENLCIFAIDYQGYLCLYNKTLTVLMPRNL